MHKLRYADANGLQHAYREAGSGSPVVLLHGIMASSRFWAPQLSGLSTAHRVIAWDAPGAGGSEDPDEFIGMEGYVRCLSAFLAELGAIPSHMVGLSWGGILALEFMRYHPELVASLVLADTYAGWKGSLSPEEYKRRRAAVVEEFETRPADYKPDTISGVISPDASDVAQAVMERELRDAHPAGYRAMARAMLDVDARDMLREIRVPTLLVWGENDERAPLRVAEEMHDAIPRARLRTIPKAGHVSSLEQPEQFNRAVLEFLEGEP